MDPVGFAASLTTLLAVAVNGAKTAYEIRTLFKKAPEKLERLFNEAKQVESIALAMQTRLRSMNEDSLPRELNPLLGQTLQSWQGDIESFRRLIEKIQGSKSTGIVGAKLFFKEHEIVEYQTAMSACLQKLEFVYTLSRDFHLQSLVTVIRDELRQVSHAPSVSRCATPSNRTQRCISPISRYHERQRLLTATTPFGSICVSKCQKRIRPSPWMSRYILQAEIDTDFGLCLRCPLYEVDHSILSAFFVDGRTTERFSGWDPKPEKVLQHLEDGHLNPNSTIFGKPLFEIVWDQTVDHLSQDDYLSGGWELYYDTSDRTLDVLKTIVSFHPSIYTVEWSSHLRRDPHLQMSEQIIFVLQAAYIQSKSSFPTRSILNSINTMQSISSLILEEALEQRYTTKSKDLSVIELNWAALELSKLQDIFRSIFPLVSRKVLSWPMDEFGNNNSAGALFLQCISTLFQDYIHIQHLVIPRQDQPSVFTDCIRRLRLEAANHYNLLGYCVSAVGSQDNLNLLVSCGYVFDQHSQLSALLESAAFGNIETCEWHLDHLRLKDAAWLALMLSVSINTEIGFIIPDWIDRVISMLIRTPDESRILQTIIIRSSGFFNPHIMADVARALVKKGLIVKLENEIPLLIERCRYWLYSGTIPAEQYCSLLKAFLELPHTLDSDLILSGSTLLPWESLESKSCWSGYTALMLALVVGYTPFIVTLLDAGASVLNISSVGLSALQLADLYATGERKREQGWGSPVVSREMDEYHLEMLKLAATKELSNARLLGSSQSVAASLQETEIVKANQEFESWLSKYSHLLKFLSRGRDDISQIFGSLKALWFKSWKFKVARELMAEEILVLVVGMMTCLLQMTLLAVRDALRDIRRSAVSTFYALAITAVCSWALAVWKNG